jgi:hypothetical protein
VRIFRRIVFESKTNHPAQALSRDPQTLQGSLGTLNDIEVHKRIAATIVRQRRHSRKRAEKALAMGFIAGQEHQQIGSCIAAAKKTGEQLSDLPKFSNRWR